MPKNECLLVAFLLIGVIVAHDDVDVVQMGLAPIKPSPVGVHHSENNVMGAHGEADVIFASNANGDAGFPPVHPLMPVAEYLDVQTFCQTFSPKDGFGSGTPNIHQLNRWKKYCQPCDSLGGSNSPEHNMVDPSNFTVAGTSYSGQGKYSQYVRDSNTMDRNAGTLAYYDAACCPKNCKQCGGAGCGGAGDNCCLSNLQTLQWCGFCGGARVCDEPCLRGISWD
jgi:hypothetical protein